VGALLGLLLGLGCVLVWRARTSAPTRKADGENWQQRTRELLVQAGTEGVSPPQLLGASIAMGLVAFVLVLGTSRVLVIALAFGGFASLLPLTLVRR